MNLTKLYKSKKYNAITADIDVTPQDYYFFIKHASEKKPNNNLIIVNRNNLPLTIPQDTRFRFNELLELCKDLPEILILTLLNDSIENWPFFDIDERYEDGIFSWRECTEKTYWNLLECLPPARQSNGFFMVGEPWDHTAEGFPIYATFGEMQIEGKTRWFCKNDSVKNFNPAKYYLNIKTQVENSPTTLLMKTPSNSYQNFKKYKVEADSVEDFLHKYYKTDRYTGRGLDYAQILLKSHTDSFNKDGYDIISHHDSKTGEVVAFYGKDQ